MQRSPTFPTIDVHGHLAVADVDQLVADSASAKAFRELEFTRFGTESWRETLALVEARREWMTDAHTRLQRLDAAGLDAQVVSVNPTQFHNWADRVLAAEIAAATNEAIAKHIADAPHRLTGLGVAPIQHADLAVEALDHALRLGLRGIEICTFSSDAQGENVMDLSSPSLEPLWDRAAQTGAVVFIHPMGTTLGKRLDRWYLSNVVGQPVETAIALSHLIFSGVFDRHPALRVIAAHGGGYLPYYIGRSDHAWRERRDAHSCERPPSEYLSSIWFDTVVFDPNILGTLVQIVGSENVLLGTDAPYDMGDHQPRSTLDRAHLDEEQRAAIASRNASQLGLAPTALTTERISTEHRTGEL
ncbi:MAG: amidohydrolase family protein [Corynebacterium sp.]|uniref:amidohydrolase family protein n=1 Tax=Corynebacterium sp. TaxID=1720 RepID=UPI003F00E27E